MLVLLMVLGVSYVAVAGGEDGEKVEISYYAYWCGALDPDSYVEKFVEDALGIDIVVRKVAHTDKEAVNLMLGSGEMPDCGWFEQSYAFMSDQELIRSIPVDVVKENAPSLIAFYDENPIFYATTLDPDDNTQFRFLSDAYDTYLKMYVTEMNIRYDWIENLGIDLGVNVENTTDRVYVADAGISLDVFTEILDKFVNGDPDQNGVNDTIGLANSWLGLRSAFGIINSNMEYDGSVVEWYTHPAMKDLLNYMQGLYADGLVYPEIFTLTVQESWELINRGMSGVQLEGAPHFLNSWANNRPPLTAFEADPNYKVLMLPGVADENGNTPRIKNPSAAGGEKFYVNADVDDEKLVSIMKLFEFSNFNDPQGTATLWNGEEGVDWEWQDDKPVKISSIINGERGTQVFCRNMQIGKAWEWMTFEPLFEAGAKYYVILDDDPDSGIWNKDLQYQYKFDIYSETDASVISNEYGKDWETVRNAYFMNVIMGEKDTEGDWDAYIDELNGLNYDKYLEELEKAPSVDEILKQFS